MTIQSLRRLVFAFFIVYLLAIIWPVVAWMRGPEPLILGFPTGMAWAIAWVLLGGLALAVLDRAECREEDRREAEEDSGDGGEGD